jgi:hypothetical protein
MSTRGSGRRVLVGIRISRTLPVAVIVVLGGYRDCSRLFRMRKSARIGEGFFTPQKVRLIVCVYDVRNIKCDVNVD